MIKAVLPFMRERRRGNIINITSMAGYVGYQASPITRAANSLLKAYLKCWRMKCAASGIKVMQLLQALSGPIGRGDR